MVSTETHNFGVLCIVVSQQKTQTQPNNVLYKTKIFYDFMNYLVLNTSNSPQSISIL